MSYAAAPLGFLVLTLKKMRLRPVAHFIQALVPVTDYPDWHWRVLDTFDWYSPQYQSKHTYEEVFRWFESEGLIHNRVLREPIGVEGQKPFGEPQVTFTTN